MSEITELESTNCMKIEIDESYDAELQTLQRKVEQSAASPLQVCDVNAGSFHVHDVEVKQEVEEPIISVQFSEASAGRRDPLDVANGVEEYGAPTPGTIVPVFQCDECFTICTSKSSLEYHVDKLHSKVLPFQCNFCHCTFMHHHELQNHLLCHKINPPYKCDNCTMTFDCLSELKEHVCVHVAKQQVELQLDFESAVYRCRMCKKDFTSKSNLKTLVCSGCSKNSIEFYKCSICKCKFNSTDRLQRHLFFHTNILAFKCDKCIKSFDHPSKLENHKSKMHKVTKLKLLNCTVCSKAFNVMSLLKDHMLSHAPFQCDHCDKTFTSITALRAHKVVHMSKEQFKKCKYCAKEFIKHKLLQHLRMSHSNNLKYKCELCILSFDTLGGLNIHITHKHSINNVSVNCKRNSGTVVCSSKVVEPTIPEQFSETSAGSRDPLEVKVTRAVELQRGAPQSGKDSKKFVPVFKCDQCLKIYKLKVSLITHVRRDHSDVFHFRCTICDCTFTKHHQLQKHLLKHDVKLANTQNYSEMVFCVPCNKRFNTQTSRDTHICALTIETPHNCDHCDKSYQTKLQLYDHHHKKHLNSNLLQCKMCNTINNKKSKSQNHLFSQKNNSDPLEVRQEAPKQLDADSTLFTCGHCGKAFKSKRSLQAHIRRVHFKVLQKCALCKCKFRSSSEWYKHLFFHNTVLEFKCDHCIKSFDQQYKLGRHIFEMHKNIKVSSNNKISISWTPHSCTICPKTFKNESALQDHVRTHTGERPFKCDQCDKDFTSNNNLKAHQKYFHTPEGRLKKCKFCAKKFEFPSELLQHLRNLHEKKLAHKCKICELSFPGSFGLKQHNRVKHSK